MSSQIDHLLNEDRRFAPPVDFAANAVLEGGLVQSARQVFACDAELRSDVQRHVR